MKIRICPYCDGEMTKAHKCDGCGSWVWKPEVLDIHFNADTRGLGEADCAYGDEHERKDHKEKDIWKAYRQPVQQLTRQHEEKEKKEEKAERRSRRAEKSGRKKKPGMVLLVIVIWMIVNLLAAVADSFDDLEFDGFDGIERIFDDPDMIKDKFENLFSDDDETQSGMVFLDSDEISAYPDGCNASGHFTMDVFDTSTVIESWIEQCYIKEGLKNFDSYESNWVDYDIENDGQPMVTLNSTWVYTLDDDDEEMVYVDYDSVTTQLHSVTMYDIPVRNVKPLLGLLINAEMSKRGDAEYSAKELNEIIEAVFAEDEADIDFDEIPFYISGRADGNTVSWCEFSVY